MSLTDVITNSCGIPWIPWCESFGWHCLTFFNSLAFVRLLGTREQGWRGHASYFWWIVQQFCPSGNKSEKWIRAMSTLKSIEPEILLQVLWVLISRAHRLWALFTVCMIRNGSPILSPTLQFGLSPTRLMAEEIPVPFILSHSAFR